MDFSINKKTYKLSNSTDKKISKAPFISLEMLIKQSYKNKNNKKVYLEKTLILDEQQIPISADPNKDESKLKHSIVFGKYYEDGKLFDSKELPNEVKNDNSLPIIQGEAFIANNNSNNGKGSSSIIPKAFFFII